MDIPFTESEFQMKPWYSLVIPCLKQQPIYRPVSVLKRKICMYLLLACLFKSVPLNYRPQTKLREGYVFTGVCHSVKMGGGVVVSQHALQV